MGKMRRLGVVFTIFSLFMAALAGSALAQQGKGPAIIVLPFQLNGSPEAQKLNAQLPELLSSRLAAKGIPTLPPAKTAELLKQYNININNLAEVRKLINGVGATHAVYGTFNQIGDDISLDARLLPGAGSGDPSPIFIEKSGLVNFSAAVDDLASRISNSVRSRQVLSDVEVRGMQALDPDIVTTRLNVRKGDPIDANTIDQEVKRIWDLGYFSDVQANLENRPSGLVLVYTLTEKPRIANIVVEGNSEVDSDDILAAMSTKKGSVLNDKVLSQDLQKITELYRKDGFYLARPSHRLEGKGPEATLVIELDEGKKLYIKEIRVEGAEQLSASDVESVLALSTRGLLSWFTGSGVLREEYLERDTAAISAYYLDNGFLHVAVGAPEVIYEEDGIIVVFKVKEGERYKLGEVAFEGDLIESADKLGEIIMLDDMAKSKEYFNLSTMQEDSKKLTDFYSDYGYAYAEASGVPREREGGEAIVDITYVIDKKQRVFVNTVEIEGNTRTRDNVILREMRLVDGDLFQGKKLRRSVERLRKLNYFEVADVEMLPTDVEDEVDLKVKLKEKNTGMISAGVGYSTYSKVGFGGTIMERNLFGKGYSLGFSGSFSSKYTRYMLSFVNPRLYDTELSVGVDTYITRDYFTDFYKRTTGGALTFSYPIGEFTRLIWGYRLEQYDLYHINDDAADIIKRYAGINMSSVAKAGFRRDTTDDSRSPTKGTIFDFMTEYGGTFLGGTDDFIKPVVDYNAFYQLVPNHVLHGRVKGGAVFKNSDKPVPVFERFYLGGINSVRGYDYEELSPRDPKSGDHIGGDRMAFMNLEYIWTFYPDLGLAIVPFYDMGFNVDTDQTNNWFKNDMLARSVGLELRWNSPMGDLRFSYGYPLQSVYEDVNSGRFEFSMGQSF